MTAGFALGPLVAGLLAQWGPSTRVVAYLPHIVFMAIVLVSLRDVRETVSGAPRPLRLSVPGVLQRRFLGVVAPIAPWVFTAPAIASHSCRASSAPSTRRTASRSRPRSYR
jgi:hypothetical protein